MHLLQYVETTERVTVNRAAPLPAGEIEQFIVDQIRHFGQDPNLVRETLVWTREQSTSRTNELNAELAAIQRQQRRDESELQKVAGAIDGDSSLARLADLQERLGWQTTGLRRF